MKLLKMKIIASLSLLLLMAFCTDNTYKENDRSNVQDFLKPTGRWYGPKNAFDVYFDSTECSYSFVPNCTIIIDVKDDVFLYNYEDCLYFLSNSVSKGDTLAYYSLIGNDSIKITWVNDSLIQKSKNRFGVSLDTFLFPKNY